MSKEWRWVTAHPDYMVSSQGDVRHRRVNAPFLLGDTDSKGYRRVGIAGKHYRVARLVCEAFHGDAPFDGAQVAHLDGNKANNSAENLGWVSQAENEAHKAVHGTLAHGERSHLCRIPDETALAILTDSRAAKEVAAAHSVSVWTVYDIRSGKRRARLPGRPNSIGGSNVTRD